MSMTQTRVRADMLPTVEVVDLWTVFHEHYSLLDQSSNMGHCISCLSSELYSFYCVHNSTTSTVFLRGGVFTAVYPPEWSWDTSMILQTNFMGSMPYYTLINLQPLYTQKKGCRKSTPRGTIWLSITWFPLNY